MPITTPKHLVELYSGGKDHFNHVLNHLFVPAIEKVGLNPILPIAEGSDIIHARIIENIEKTDLILCDMSTLNPNVFFELGIRTAVDKPVCMVVDNQTEKIPFDASIINYHIYNSSIELWTIEKDIEALSQHIQKALSSDKTKSLWRYFSLSSKAKFSEEDTGIDAKIDLLLMEFEGLKRQLKDAQKGSTIKLPMHLSPYHIENYIRNAFNSAGCETPLSIIIDEDSLDTDVFCTDIRIPDDLYIMIKNYANLNDISIRISKPPPPPPHFIKDS